MMAADPLAPIREALRNGDKAAARRLLPPLIKAQPSADLWTLAAQACDKQEDAIKCLRKALELDPLHSRANRMLFKLEGAKPPTAEEWQRLTTQQPRSAPAPKVDPIPLKKPKRQRRLNPWRVIGCLSFLLLGSACSLFTLNMVGVISGMFTTATVLLGGPTPVSQWEGQPLVEVTNAPVVVPPSQSEVIGDASSEQDFAERTSTGGRDADVLEPGYSHEYRFDARRGASYAIYIQFLSLDANRVSRNVAVIRPDGTDATSLCDRSSILEGDNNVTYICDIDATGEWKVRILGRDGESVGAYFVGIERMQG